MKVIKGFIYAAAVLLILFSGGYALLHSSWFEGYITQQASNMLGRKVRLGALDLGFSMPQRVEIRALDLWIANPSWAQSSHFFDAQQLEGTILLSSLLRGDLRLSRVAVRDAVLNLERRADGQANWAFKTSGKGRLPVETLAVDNSRLTFEDRKLQISAALQVTQSTDRPKPLHIQGTGTRAGTQFDLELQAGSLLKVLQQASEYPVDLRLSAGDSRFTANGTMGMATIPPSISLDIRLQEPARHPLLALAGLEASGLAALRVTAHVASEAGTWQVTQLEGTLAEQSLNGKFVLKAQDSGYSGQGHLTLGESELEGEVEFAGEASKPKFTFDLSSDRLNLSQLQALWPKDIPEPQAEAIMIPADALRGVDVSGNLQCETLILDQGLQFDSLEATVKLEEGILHLAPMTLQTGGGELSAQVDLTATMQPTEISASGELKRLDIGWLLKDTAMAGKLSGVFGGHFQMQSRGEKVPELLNQSSATMELAMAQGVIEQALIEKVGADLMETLVASESSEPVQIRCGVAQLEGEKGQFRLSKFLLASTDTNITGEGTLNLAQKTLDLVFIPHPKDMSAIAAPSPIHVSGSLLDPQISVDKGSVTARVGAALALGAFVTPLAALVPFIELGEGDHQPCRALLENVRQSGAPDSSNGQ